MSIFRLYTTTLDKNGLYIDRFINSIKSQIINENITIEVYILY